MADNRDQFFYDPEEESKVADSAESAEEISGQAESLEAAAEETADTLQEAAAEETADTLQEAADQAEEIGQEAARAADDIPELVFGAQDPEIVSGQNEGADDITFPEESTFSVAEDPSGMAEQASGGEESIASEALSFVQAAARLLARRNELKTDRDSLEGEKEQAVRAVASLEESIEAAVSERSRVRREAVSSGFDERVSECRAEISGKQEERKKAKADGIEQKIIEVNEPLAQETAELKEQLTHLYKDNKISALVRNPIVSSLYFPKGLTDWLLIGAACIVLFFCVPFLFCSLLQGHPFSLSIVLFIYIMAAGGLYLFLLNHQMLPKKDALEKGVELKKHVKANTKQMNAAAEEIRRAQDETGLGLEVFDEAISGIESRITGIEEERRAAIDEFEATVPGQILEEVTEENRAAREELEEQERQLEERIGRTAEEIDGISGELKEIYEPVLGGELLEEGDLSGLEQFCRENPAVSLNQAVESYKTSR